MRLKIKNKKVPFQLYDKEHYQECKAGESSESGLSANFACRGHTGVERWPSTSSSQRPSGTESPPPSSTS